MSEDRGFLPQRAASHVASRVLNRFAPMTSLITQSATVPVCAEPRAGPVVELLYFDGCPNYEALLPELRGILQREGIETDIDLRHVETQEEAARVGFLGSPTVRVDGSDVEAAAAGRRDFGLKCRLYQTPNGLQGVPPEEWILAAIRGQAKQR